jgi:hypothetical protein
LAPFLPCAGGLPGFVGPFPSTSLDESDITHDSIVCVLETTVAPERDLALFLFYGKNLLLVNCKERSIPELVGDQLEPDQHNHITPSKKRKTTGQEHLQRKMSLPHETTYKTQHWIN